MLLTRQNGDREAARPLGAAEFAALMAPLGPWGEPPRAAVACSGGRDSMALALLAADWAAAAGIGLTVLIVDHRLRRESATEAAQTAAWLQARGLACQCLVWDGDKPAANRAAAARAARYRLLVGWCHGHDVASLLTAHHLDDQAETFLLRLARGSGVDGLAAMAPVSLVQGVRLVRPLLAVPRVRLAATCRAAGQPWHDDPSNASLATARGRLRRLLPGLAAEGLTVSRLAATAGHMARARAALEAAAAGLFDRAVTLHPAGYALLAADTLATAPAEIGLRTLVSCLRLIGGALLPPRFARLQRLYGEIVGDGGLRRPRTLLGCRLLPWRGGVLVCREPAAIGPAVVLPAGAAACWDGRFAVGRAGGGPPAEVRPLGAAWRRLTGSPAVHRAAAALPGAVRPTLPALWDPEGVVAVPHLTYLRAGAGVRFTAQFPLSAGSLSAAADILC